MAGSIDCNVVVRAVDINGRPVPDAAVAVVKSTAPFPEVALLVDAHGEITLRLPPGVFTLRADTFDGRSATATLTVPGAESDVVALVLS